MISHLRETTVSAKHPAPISVREQNKQASAGSLPQLRRAI